ncbi:MAG TPA: OmpA family protein [Syntrophales bacterium]|jgi:chemotaxis protein MotB|nr:OmpA family protein [Syntrophales bacterium]HON22463.1 OmpA family protein [Syntrophales bacterium]HOU78274.1 OmpA family protein [Syntrophales bacterium]HPC33193.1 OmpA family protein [Syntrophales bacterium]HQG34561.1 OmpA family protein [Syntrophales bacterium]
MTKKTFPLLFALLALVLVTGCVAKSDYLKKVAEADGKAQELKTCNLEKDKLLAQRGELEKLLKTEENAARQKIADLQAENTKLKSSVAFLQKKEEIIQKESDTYKDLVREMKGEIAKGQVTITELKGKLTLDVVDKILFASGEAKVKKEGLEVLKRVVDILKNLKDKSILVEGHTDNVQIRGQLAQVYPTNWELSAARAINVARYLQSQGINPELLKAVACGEYKPVADNSTAEGRQKNRRIAIVLSAKD